MEKKKKEKPEGGEGYLEDSIFGKKDDDLDDAADEEESVDSEAGVDDTGAMSKYFNCTPRRSFPWTISRIHN